MEDLQPYSAPLPDPPAIRPSEPAAPAPTETRRSFLADLGRKARYVVPVVVTLAMTERAAAGSGTSVSGGG